MGGRLVRGGLVAVLALAGAIAMPRAALALSYRLIEADLPECRGACPKIIYASGTIALDELDRFSAFIERLPDKERVSMTLLIDSPGGFSYGGQAMGLLARKLKMTVFVARPTESIVTRTSGLTGATCASACVFVLAGGAKRLFGPGSRVGVHRSHTGSEVRDPLGGAPVNGKLDYEEVRGRHKRYYKLLGIDPRLAELADKTPSEGIHWLTPEEMGRYRLARQAGTTR